MVNTGFRPPFHGFEMVDAWDRKTSVNRKFTRPAFRRNFT
jgi:hypothetical protein